MKTVGRILTIIMVLAASSRVQAERTGPGTYRGYYSETRWGDRVLHLGPYHTFVSETAAKALLKHKGKPLEVEVIELSSETTLTSAAPLIDKVGEVKEKGSHTGLVVSAAIKANKVTEGKGVEVTICLTNRSAKAITVMPGELALVLAAQTGKKVEYKDPDNRSYWYYTSSFFSPNVGSMRIACHQALLRWSDGQFSGIEVDPARNRVRKGDRITVGANGTFTASYTAAKALPEGEYELFVYLVSGNLSSVPGPMSARLAFDVVAGDDTLR